MKVSEVILRIWALLSCHRDLLMMVGYIVKFEEIRRIVAGVCFVYVSNEYLSIYCFEKVMYFTGYGF